MSKYAARVAAVKVSKERMYDIIRFPIITEKASLAAEHNQVAFKVPMDASKPEIRQAVETLFDVKVAGVNTLVQKGKEKRFRGRLGQRTDTKKAYVSLAEGQQIDTGVGA